MTHPTLRSGRPRRPVRPKRIGPVARISLSARAKAEAAAAIPTFPTEPPGELTTPTTNELRVQVAEQQIRRSARLAAQQRPLRVALAANRHHHAALSQQLVDRESAPPPLHFPPPMNYPGQTEIEEVRAGRRTERWRAETENACAETRSQLLGLEIEAAELQQELDSTRLRSEYDIESYRAYTQRRLALYWQRLCRRHPAGTQLVALQPVIAAYEPTQHEPEEHA